MPVYNLHHTGYVSRIETLEADNSEHAMEIAQEGNVSLCHQCTNEWEPEGDGEITAVYDETGELVWEPERARPLPTLDQISEALLAAWLEQTKQGVQATPAEHCRTLAGGVMALLNGESNG